MKWEDILRSSDNQLVKSAPVLKDYFELFKSKNKQIALDYGCGNGRNTIEMLRQGFYVIGCDISKNILSIAQNNIELYKIFANYKLDLISNLCVFSDNYFDFCISISSIHHDTLDKIRDSLILIKRLLKKGGYLILVVPSYDHATYGYGNEIEKDTFITTKGIDKGIIHHFFSHESLNALLVSVGFSVVEIKDINKEKLHGYNDGHIFTLSLI